MMDQTTMVLMIDLPPRLSLRLERASKRHSDRDLRALALEALEQWVERDERAHAAQPVEDSAAPGR